VYWERPVGGDSFLPLHHFDLFAPAFASFRLVILEEDLLLLFWLVIPAEDLRLPLLFWFVIPEENLPLLFWFVIPEGDLRFAHAFAQFLNSSLVPSHHLDLSSSKRTCFCSFSLSSPQKICVCRYPSGLSSPKGICVSLMPLHNF
jgi:hypothetical protein